jgi:hypothetical protein
MSKKTVNNLENDNKPLYSNNNKQADKTAKESTHSKKRKSIRSSEQQTCDKKDKETKQYEEPKRRHDLKPRN